MGSKLYADTCIWRFVVVKFNANIIEHILLHFYFVFLWLQSFGYTEKGTTHRIVPYSL